MKFYEWWEKYKWNAGLEQGAYDAYNEGLKEGLRRAVEEQSDTSQGGGSQEATTKAQKPVPCQGGCPTLCAGCPRA